MTDSHQRELKWLRVEPLADSLGARVEGLDLSQPIDPEAMEELQWIWRRYLVLVFANQPLGDEQQVRFSRSFGELEIYPLGDNRSVAHPEIFRVSNCDENGVLLPPDDPETLWNNLTEYWHTDSSYRPIPAKGAILHGIEVPDCGGDTLFVNLAAALDSLPMARRQSLEGLVAVHDWQYGYEYAGHLMKAMDQREVESVPAVRHPLIRFDRQTARHALFISPAYVGDIDGMTQSSARALIGELTDWAAQSKFTYRHQWSPHDVVMWYNPLTMHAREAFNFGCDRRIMHRTTIVGEAQGMTSA